jgi:hypothetical protein
VVVRNLKLGFVFIVCFYCGERKALAQAVPTSSPPKTATFLDSLSYDTFRFFWEQAEPSNGNQPDRWPTPAFSSIAATGFGLPAYIIGVENGYITRAQAAERVSRTLKFFMDAPKGSGRTGVTGYKGFFYHFLDAKTGLRFEDVELSTVDTGLLMAGILTCQAYFDGNNELEKSIRTMAEALYRAVDWGWSMNGQKEMSMGWHPGENFLDAKWKGYNEGMILYILAIASPTHPIPASSWTAWTDSYQWGKYEGMEHVNFGPLFGHQYSHMFIDFKGIQDIYMKSKGIDYFENSRRATLANRASCIANSGGYVGYGENMWGLTGCDGPGNDKKKNPNVHFDGYTARGAGQFYYNDDGTIAPTAAGGSIPFAPEECIAALKAMKKAGKGIYDKYGFKDAFNMSIEYSDGTKGWVDKDYLGIDQGPILIQLENYRSGVIWNILKKSPYIRDGLKKAGFTGGWLN